MWRVQGDKIVGDWPDIDDDKTRVGWGWQTGAKKQPQFITFQLCIAGAEWRKKSDVAFLEIEYHPYKIHYRSNPQAIILSVKGWPYHWSARARLGQRCAWREGHSEPRQGYVAKNFGEALQLSLADKTLI